MPRTHARWKADIGCVRRPSSVRLCLRPPAVEFTRLSCVWPAGGGCAPPVISQKKQVQAAMHTSELCMWSCMCSAEWQLGSMCWSSAPIMRLPALGIHHATMLVVSPCLDMSWQMPRQCRARQRHTQQSLLQTGTVAVVTVTV
jgi:hypothetical protein